MSLRDALLRLSVPDPELASNRRIEDAVIGPDEDWTRVGVFWVTLPDGLSFTRTNLYSAGISMSSLPYASFFDCRLEAADFSGTLLYRGFFSNVLAVGVSFRDADLRYSVFRDSNLSEALLTGAKMQHTTFVRCDFTKAMLGHANFEDVEFVDCRGIAHLHVEAGEDAESQPSMDIYAVKHGDVPWIQWNNVFLRRAKWSELHRNPWILDHMDQAIANIQA